MRYDIKYYSNSANERITQFCKINGIDLNENITNIPFYTFNEYWKIHKALDVSDYNPDDMYEDMGCSEAILLPNENEKTGCYGIVVPERLIKYSREYNEIILIHEKLHYMDLMNYKNSQTTKMYEELEAEVTVMSILIEFYGDKTLEEILAQQKYECVRMYSSPEIIREVIEVLIKITPDDFRRRLECKN